MNRRSLLASALALIGIGSAATIAMADKKEPSLKPGLRMSSQKGDPGYATFLAVIDEYYPTVHLNGSPVKLPITADEAQGFVVVVKTGENGRYLVEDDKIVTETLYGDVMIVLHKHPKRRPRGVVI